MTKYWRVHKNDVKFLPISQNLINVFTEICLGHNDYIY
jgi:hypothetical protein